MRADGRAGVTGGPTAGRSAMTDARLLHLLVLGVPYLVVIAGWRGLSLGFPSFQGAGEVIHYDIVRMVAEQWPRGAFCDDGLHFATASRLRGRDKSPGLQVDLSKHSESHPPDGT